MKSPRSFHFIEPLANFSFSKSAATLVLGLLLSGTGWSEDITWSAGNSSNGFNKPENYTPSPESFDTQDLIFDAKVSSGLAASANMNLGSITIRNGADGFVLGGATRSLAFKGAGIFVEQNTSATFKTAIVRHSVNSVGALNVDVGDNGTLFLDGDISPITTSFNKNGAGTLVISKGSGAVRSLSSGSASFHFNEGVTQILDGAKIQWGSDMDPEKVLPQSLNVTLGTSTQMATLTGSGQINGRLSTAATENAYIRPEGTLTIHTLDATNGATLAFELGQDLLSGAGIFMGSDFNEGVAFSFQGGEANTPYTLLSYAGLEGLEASDFKILTEGYELDTSFGDGGWLIDAANGQLQVRFAAIPEPGAASMVLTTGILLGVFARHFSPLKTRKW